MSPALYKNSIPRGNYGWGFQQGQLVYSSFLLFFSFFSFRFSLRVCRAFF